MLAALWSAGFCGAFCPCAAVAADPPLHAARPALRWGGDQEGGGPYIYPRDDDPTRLIGFEVELADALADELGMQAQFVQCNWEQILPILSRGDIDLALNGYEYTTARAEHYLPSIPYYIYELGLCARKDDDSIVTWESLEQPLANGKQRRIGVLEASAADQYVTERYGHVCEVVRFEGATEVLRLVETRQLDATVQDLPILQFYVVHLKRYPKLKSIEHVVAPGDYVIYARPGDEPLINSVNAAIQKLYHSGKLRKIYERYGVWNPSQERLPEIWDKWDARPEVAVSDKWLTLARQAPLLLHAAGITVLLAVLSMPAAVAIGLMIALGRSWKVVTLGKGDTSESIKLRMLRGLFTTYVEIVRGTPLAFQLFVVYFVLPEVGLTISAFWAGVIALAVNYSAYEAEIWRLGLQAIPRGQMEAALSLGMSRRLAVQRVVLPQAVRLVIPATANDFIALFKDTAVCSVIAVEELSKQYSMGARSTGLFLEMALLASVLYLLMSYPLSLVAGWLERTLKRDGH